MHVETRKIEIGFCWGFAKTEPERGLARLKSHGFDGIELWPAPIHEHGAAAWRRALEATGLRCLQLCPYFNFMGGAPTIARSREILSEFMELAHELGCPRLRVFTGPPWGEGVVGGASATDRQWHDAIDTLREFCDTASAQGLELCLECHEGSLMEDAPSALRLLRSVDRRNLTTNLQLPLLREPWEESLRLLGPFTAHVHIHNWTRGLGEGDLTFLEAGAFDWLPVVRELCFRYGRDVCLSVEHPDHGGRHDPWETARRDGTFLQKLRAALWERPSPM